jgi:LAS superfamily LD-carboxypeptidase LdcB
LLAAVAGGLGLAALTSCQPAAQSTQSPISPWDSPTPIDGYSNGYLPEALLYDYDANCQLYRPAAGSFQAMVAAAHQDGVELKPAQGYRDYADQIYWRNYWCDAGICGNAAVPGYSNHGWGKAVDFTDQNGSLTWSSVGYDWLTTHAGDFGWNHPGDLDEAWHWEWVGDGGTMHGYAIRPDLMSWAPLPQS